MGLIGCASGPKRYANWSYQAPETTQDWRAASAGSHGVLQAPLQDMVQSMARKSFFDVHSIILVHRGELILEVHDRESRRDEPHDLRSATKSITSLLVGIAVDRGLLNIDAPLGASARPLAQPELTPRQLLTMSSGLDCDDRSRQSAGFEERMYRTKDWLAFWRALPASTTPRPRYCTAGVVALGAELAERTGQPVPNFADQVLFTPLGIPSPHWDSFDGGTDTGGHLRLSPRDLAKIGQVMLDAGMWKGQRVVSASWIEAMTSPALRLDGIEYGRLVWLGSYGGAQSQDHALWQFRGNGGQYVFILPDHELVAVFTGGAYNSPKAMVPFQLMGRFVLPALGVQGPQPAP